LKLFVDFDEDLNLLLKDKWSFAIRSSLGHGDDLSVVIDVAFYAINQWSILHFRTLFLLIEEIVIFCKAHRVLLENFAKIQTCIFRFEEITIVVTQVSTSFVERDKNIKIINLILTHEIMDPLIYDESWLRIGDLGLINKILVVIDIYTLYKILLSRIQLILVFLVL